MIAGEAYYRENYPDYERQNPPRKLDFYMRLVRRWAPRGGRLHELGVGLGAFIARASLEYRCSGTDINPYGLQEAARRAPGVALWAGSVDTLTGAPPDVIVAWDVLEHLPHLEEGLGRIGASLAPGGVLIAVVPVYDGPLGWLVRRLDRDPTHVSKWPRRQWLSTLERCGFQIEATGGVLRRLIARRWYLHLTWPAAVWRRAGSALWFVARPRSPRRETHA
jgi:SAM-dependent methyltransferase